ncbi:sarcosine oxidase subunit gamma [Rhodobacterales bacterium HKCCE2091]|nr:sarcosine oxidase subunit gamma [Rhodobacterales bacterium HKCCE2091]
MSNPDSALPDEVHEGIAAVREMGPQGMVTLRGDHAAVAGAVQSATGFAVPGQRRIDGDLGNGIAWMSPDELLILCDHGAAPGLTATLAQSLAGTHHLAADVSDAREVFSLDGPGAREALAKLAPVDLAPGRFEPGELRRTRLAQVPAAFWMAGPETFCLVVFRSVARYAFDILAKAAAPGSSVGHF